MRHLVVELRDWLRQHSHVAQHGYVTVLSYVTGHVELRDWNTKAGDLHVAGEHLDRLLPKQPAGCATSTKSRLYDEPGPSVESRGSGLAHSTRDPPSRG